MKLRSPASFRKRLRERRRKKKDRIRDDLERYGRTILRSDEMRRAYQQTHHTRSTVGEHIQRVAEKSLAICYALDRLHIRTDIPAVVAGSLCHDLGILGRDEKYGSEKECYRRHPADSLAVAQRLMPALPEKTPDIIERHMWPGAGSRVPNSLEAFVVSLADKAAAAEDFIRGSRLKPVGFRETVENIMKRSTHRGKHPGK